MNGQQLATLYEMTDSGRAVQAALDERLRLKARVQRLESVVSAHASNASDKGLQDEADYWYSILREGDT